MGLNSKTKKDLQLLQGSLHWLFQKPYSSLSLSFIFQFQTQSHLQLQRGKERTETEERIMDGKEGLVLMHDRCWWVR